MTAQAGVCVVTAEHWGEQLAMLAALRPGVVRMHLYGNVDVREHWGPVFSYAQLEQVRATMQPGGTLILRSAEGLVGEAEMAYQLHEVLPGSQMQVLDYIATRLCVWEVSNEVDKDGLTAWEARWRVLGGARYARRVMPIVDVCVGLPTHHAGWNYLQDFLSDTGDGLGRVQDVATSLGVHGYGANTLAANDFADPFAVYEWVKGLGLPVWWTEAGIHEGRPWEDRAKEYARFVRALPEQVRGVTFFLLESSDPKWATLRMGMGGAAALSAALASPDGPGTTEGGDMRRSVYVWYYNGTAAKADEIAGTGATVALVKAGGDRGVTWIPDPAPEGFENEQWDDAYLRPLTVRGVTVYPWFYNWPAEVDKQSVLDALAHRWSDVIVLNPETEWRVQSHENPFQNLAQANAAAQGWVLSLKEMLHDRFGKVPRIGYSAVPTWVDFPYEGFSVVCDFAMPQHYWPDELMAADGEAGSEAGEDQVEAHLRRAGKGKPCYPIITACREYDDAGVVALAVNALGDYPDLAGFSAWEAGNAAFQAGAMREVFALLPDETGPGGEGGRVGVVTPSTDWEGEGEVVSYEQVIIVRNSESGKVYLRREVDRTMGAWVELTQ